MNTDHFVSSLKMAQAEREAARQRWRRNLEIRQFLLGGSLVMSGLLLAAMCRIVV